jgi:hypothetical protein
MLFCSGWTSASGVSTKTQALRTIRSDACCPSCAKRTRISMPIRALAPDNTGAGEFLHRQQPSGDVGVDSRRSGGAEEQLNPE